MDVNKIIKEKTDNEISVLPNTVVINLFSIDFNSASVGIITAFFIAKVINYFYFN